ncbi:MAG: CDP-alcohol phosphatidyltransferase family protein, partial [Anaerolineales bacterium]
MTHKYRYLIPNSITFTSLTCGVISILAAVSGHFAISGGLITTSYVLDLLDGVLARKLNADSEFGVQLDSLVDMVSLGTAPPVLVFAHLRAENYPFLPWVWVFAILFVMAGAFRLARFNLGPAKTTTDLNRSSAKDTVGLTISAAGVALALAVLADISPDLDRSSRYQDFFPNHLFLPLMAAVSLLMVSRIPHPAFGQVFGDRRISPFVVVAAVLL